MTDVTVPLKTNGEILKAAVEKEPLTGAIRESGSKLLNDVRTFIKRFCAFPDEHCLDAVTLWAALTHMVLEFYTTPRLSVLSPELGSGKTRVLEILALLVSKSSGVFVNPSTATIFRLLAQEQITFLLDEIDTVFTQHGKDDDRADLRALLNSGYKSNATIPRCVGAQHEVVKFKVFCAVALAGLGDLPDTIMSRSVIIKMRRRGPKDHIEPLRPRIHDPEGAVLQERLAEWGQAVGNTAGAAWPELPAGIVDRPAEVWEPLIAVADAAGGEWPDRARTACVHLCRVAEDRRVSLRLRLLSDVRILFGDADAMHTQTLVELLTTDEDKAEPKLDADAPWASLRGNPLSKRGLATMLRPFDVRPEKVTIRGVSLQGYRREVLWDAWERYLPSHSSGPELPEFAELSDLGKPSDSVAIPGIPGIPAIPDNRAGRAYCEDLTEPSDKGAYDDPERLREIEAEYQGMPKDQEGDNGSVVLPLALNKPFVANSESIGDWAEYEQLRGAGKAP